MAIVLIRIDDRLVHGQVVEGWLPQLKADQVVVVSEEVAADQTQQSLMAMALPGSAELKTFGVEAALRYLSSAPEERRILVLAPSPVEILEMVRRGLTVKSVNVGGMHYSVGRVQLGRAIFLSPEDRAALQEMAQRGILLEGRGVPSDRPQDVVALIRSSG